MLDDEEVGGGVRGGGFERKRTEAQGVEMSGAVLAGGDGMERGPGGRGSLGYEVVQGCGGGNGREGLEE